MRVPDALTDGPRFAAFCERYCVHTKGRWSGRPFILEDPWQTEFWWEALEVDPTTGLRVYTEVGQGIPRKNGKSMQASAAGLYGLSADNEAEPEVYVGASHRGQAGIVLGQSRSIVRRSPRLLRHLQVQAHRILCPANDGIMRAVSSDGPQQTGLNPSWSIIDEIHAHKTADLYTALTTGTGAREQPFTFWITTAGGTPDGLLAGLYEQMFSGAGELEKRPGLTIYRDRANGVLIYWYGAGRDDDIEDPAVWQRVNPASWLQDGKYLRREFGRLKSRGELVAWRTFHLNQFVGSEEAWLPEGAWAGDFGPVMFDPEQPLGVGIFKTHDSAFAAIARAQRQGERVVTDIRWYTPTEATGRVDNEAMRVYLRTLRAEFPSPATFDPRTLVRQRGPAFAFDRWAFSESADTLDQQGLNMVDFPQYASTMGPASTQAFELITTGRLVHEGDAVLTEHIEASKAILTDRGMKVVPNRRRGTRPNHGAIALIMATAMAMQERPRTIVDTRQAAGW